MERIEKLQAEVAALEARYFAETNLEHREAIGSNLDAWYSMLKWAKYDYDVEQQRRRR